jgi:hypothetical protein
MNFRSDGRIASRTVTLTINELELSPHIFIRRRPGRAGKIFEQDQIEIVPISEVDGAGAEHPEKPDEMDCGSHSRDSKGPGFAF